MTDKKPHIVCSSSVACAQKVFSSLGKVSLIDGPSITHEDIIDADALVIRSTTPVNPQLLKNTRVNFVGTATIGTDHMDIDYLEKNNIRWCYSPGCNANSVAEYVVCALIYLAITHNIKLEGKTIGVIGVGNVGSLVVEKARALGIRTLCNDPPRVKEEKPEDPAFVDLDTVLAESDFITMHVPLTYTGDYPTHHMADKTFFEKIKPGAVFINAARGAVVDTNSLIFALTQKIISHAVIDTWENEPLYNTRLLDLSTLATPHIAGYSLEGKVHGTIMVYNNLCDHLDRKPEWGLADLLPAAAIRKIDPQSGLSENETLWNIVSRIYDISQDDKNLRTGPKDENRASHFKLLRKNYPARREFRWTTVKQDNKHPDLNKKIKALGFQVDTISADIHSGF